MVYAHRVNRVTISGTMFGGAEEWSTGFFYGQEGADSAPGTSAMALAVLTAWRTFCETANSHMSSAYLTTQVKVAALKTDGKTDTGDVNYAYPSTELKGTVSAIILPPQCSLVVTLMSDRPRGKASKGRMYLPGIAAMPAVTTGKLPSTTVGSIATNLQTFFNALEASADVPDELILAAKQSGLLGVSPAQNDFVESLKVGDVIDTQRRRRNGLAESYTLKALV